MSETLIAVPLSELPYPHGLGKGEYKELENDLKAYLPERLWWDVATHRSMMETFDQTYLDILRRGLDRFRSPDILDVADEAVRIAHTLDDFGKQFSGQALQDAKDRIAAAATGDVHPYVRSWVRYPPQISNAGLYIDGRHRIAALRVFTSTPDMPVLVSIVD